MMEIELIEDKDDLLNAKIALKKLEIALSEKEMAVLEREKIVMEKEVAMMTKIPNKKSDKGNQKSTKSWKDAVIEREVVIYPFTAFEGIVYLATFCFFDSVLNKCDSRKIMVSNFLNFAA